MTILRSPNRLPPERRIRIATRGQVAVNYLLAFNDAAQHFGRKGNQKAKPRIQLFGGPRRLVEIAAKLASAREPTPERLICHPRDYELAGCYRNGPVTWIAVIPPLTSFNFTPWKFGEPMPEELQLRKCSLEPDPCCPSNEIRVLA